MSVAIDIIDDGIHEENETFIATLKRNDSIFNDVFIGTPSTAVGIIIDDDELCKHLHMIYAIVKRYCIKTGFAKMCLVHRSNFSTLEIHKIY